MAKKTARKAKDPTLGQIKAKIKAKGFESLTAKEAKAISAFQALAKSKAKSSDDAFIKSAKFSVKKALFEIEEEIYNAYMTEMRTGKGIARIQAADRLRDWADILGVNQSDQVAAEISFLPVGVDESGKIVRIKSA